MIYFCDEKDCEGKKCDSFFGETKRLIKYKKKNIINKFLKSNKLKHKKITMRPTEFLLDTDLYGF